MKFETFIKKEYRDPIELAIRKWATLPPVNPIKKFYYVRVYDKGHLIDEVKFCNAIDAQNFIQNTELFYSKLV